MSTKRPKKSNPLIGVIGIYSTSLPCSVSECPCKNIAISCVGTKTDFFLSPQDPRLEQEEGPGCQEALVAATGLGAIVLRSEFCQTMAPLRQQPAGGRGTAAGTFAASSRHRGAATRGYAWLRHGYAVHRSSAFASCLQLWQRWRCKRHAKSLQTASTFAKSAWWFWCTWTSLLLVFVKVFFVLQGLCSCLWALSSTLH